MTNAWKYKYEIRLGPGETNYIIRWEAGHNFPMYLQRVYKGKFIWNHDYMWAKLYSRETTVKHIRSLTGGDC